MADNYFHGEAQPKKSFNPKQEDTPMSINDYFNLDAGLNKNVGEELEKFIESYKTRMGKSTKVIVLNDPNVRAPVIYAVRGGKAFGLLIEAGITKPLTTRASHSMGRIIQRNETAADIVDKNFVDISNKFLESQGAKSTIIGVAVVPKSADLTKDNVLGYCVCYSNQAIIGDAVGITAKAIAESNYKLVNTYTFSPDTTNINAFGVALATDFRINTTMRKTDSKSNNINSSLNEDTDQLTFARVNGRIDSFYQPKVGFSGMNQSNILFGQQQMPEPGYIGLIILNDINGLSDAGRGRETLLTQLVGIASAAKLATNHNFARIWQPIPGEVNTKENPGLVALEHNVFNDMNFEPQELKVQHGVGKTKDNEMNLSQLISSYFHKTALIVLEVEKYGPISFIQNKLMKAAQGDMAALKEISDELDKFTGNNFSPVYDTKKDGIAAVRPVTIHSGYYLAADNNTRIDITSVDHMRKLRAYGTEPTAMYHLSPSPEKNSFEALFKRYEFLTNIAPSFQQTGWKTQVFFKPKFIQGMIKAFDLAKVRMGTENLDTQENGLAPSNTFSNILGELDVGFDLGDIFTDSVMDIGGDSLLSKDMLDLGDSLI